MKRLLFKLYVRYIRSHTEKAFNRFFEIIQPTKSVVWEMYKHLPMDSFSDVINKYTYTPDLLGGVVDHAFSYNNPNKFFDGMHYGQDCDNWARIWGIWGECNGYRTQEVIVTTKKHVAKDAHVITILEKDGKYWCANYRIFGPFTTFEQAVEAVCVWKKYNKSNLLWLRYNALR